MILVDVFVPSIDMNYDFQLNEDVPIRQVIDEVAQLVEQKEHTKVVGNVEELLLCSKTDNSVLDVTKSLSEQGIKSGHSLILV